MSAQSRQLVFAALADPTRRELLDRLRGENGQSLSALAQNLGMSRQAVTKHLRMLEAAELVQVVRQGRSRRHYLNPVPIQAVALRWLGEFGSLTLGTLSDLSGPGPTAR